MYLDLRQGDREEAGPPYFTRSKTDKKMMAFLSVIFLLLSSLTTTAGPNACESTLPPLVDDAVQGYAPPGEGYSFSPQIGGQNLEVKYVKYPSTSKPAKGTVLFLCGGPGAVCVRGRPSAIPQDYDVVTFDYFGMGQNKKYNQPNQMAIETQGEVAAKLAQHLNEPRLIIYGQSFGTAVGTVAASQLSTKSSRSKTILQGVMLEGVLAPSKEDASLAYKKAADYVWSHLSEKEKQNFKAEYQKRIQNRPDDKYDLDAKLTMSLSDGANTAMNTLKTFRAEEFKVTDDTRNYLNRPQIRNMYLAAGCQIENSSRNKNQYIFGNLVQLNTITSGAEQLCKCRTVQKNFNPNDYQVKVPMIYINSGLDPKTPFAMARDHFAGQANTDKAFITNPIGGHGESNMSLAGCMPRLFDALLSHDLVSIRNEQNKMGTEGCSSAQTATTPAMR